METALTNELPDYPRGITFEQVWAAIMEDRKNIAEQANIMAEQAKNRAKFDAEWEEAKKEMRELSRQMGGLHNSFGEMAEHMVAPGIEDKFNEIGFNFDSVATKGMKITGADKKIKAQIDIVMENGEYIVAVEVKTKVAIKDIDYAIRQLEVLREYKPNDNRKILGAIAGVVFNENEKRAAIEAGFYILVQSGDTMKMEIPDSFVPREW